MKKNYKKLEVKSQHFKNATLSNISKNTRIYLKSLFVKQKK